MLDTQFAIYCKQNVALIKSIVFKSEIDILLSNSHMKGWGEEINENDPTTWKYYKNIAGEYYVSNSPYRNFSDEPMTVLSVEDGTEIPFDKTTLATNTLTKVSFHTYKDELVRRFPKQESLIYNIINPIDINKAITASDLEILWYDASLVGPNEITLMSKIQKFMWNFKDRYFKKDFQISDPKYVHSFYSVMMLMTINATMNFRLEACGSPEVAEYHLWNFLGDHYELNQYRTSLNRQQSLWLYRNMVDIQRNSGQQWILDELISKLARPKGLVATKFDFVRQDPDSFLNGRGIGAFVQREFDDDVINLDYQPLSDAENMLFKTRDKAAKNRDEYENDIDKLKYKTNYETRNGLPTGLIEFNLVEGSVNSVVSDTREKIEYWLYLSALGLYNNTVTFTVPNSGTITLNTADAFLLYEYARFARNGIHLKEINPIVAREVVSYAPITIDTMRPYYEDKYISEDFVNETLADRIPSVVVTDAASLDAYVSYIKERRVRHITSMGHMTASRQRAQAEQLTEGVYDNYTCTFVPDGTLYSEWLSDKRIQLSNITKNDWDSVVTDLLFVFTGLDLNNIGIGLSKQAMIEIIDRITSYGIIITDGVGTGEVKEFPIPFFTPDISGGSKVSEVNVDAGNVKFKDHYSEQGSKVGVFEFKGDEIEMPYVPKITEKWIDLDFEIIQGPRTGNVKDIHIVDISIAEQP